MKSYTSGKPTRLRRRQASESHRMRIMLSLNITRYFWELSAWALNTFRCVLTPLLWVALYHNRKVPLQDCYKEAKITWLRRRQASESHWMRMMLSPNMIRRLPARAASNFTGSGICRLHCSGRNTLLNSFSARPSGVPEEHAWHLK